MDNLRIREYNKDALSSAGPSIGRRDLGMGPCMNRVWVSVGSTRHEAKQKGAAIAEGVRH